MASLKNKSAFKIMVILIIGIISLIFFSIETTSCKKETIELKGTKYVDLISIIDDCGTLSSMTNSVYLVEKGQKVETFDEPFFISETDKVTYKWLDYKTLLVTMNYSNIYRFVTYENINGTKYDLILEIKNDYK